jgi:hypothetical protein
LSVDDIQGFGVTDYGDYKAIQVSYHTGKIAGTDSPEKFSDSIETGKYFLKILSKEITHFLNLY